MKSQLKAIQQYKRDGSNGYQQVKDMLLMCIYDGHNNYKLYIYLYTTNYNTLSIFYRVSMFPS